MSDTTISDTTTSGTTTAPRFPPGGCKIKIFEIGKTSDGFEILNPEDYKEHLHPIRTLDQEESNKALEGMLTEYKFLHIKENTTKDEVVETLAKEMWIGGDTHFKFYFRSSEGDFTYAGKILPYPPWIPPGRPIKVFRWVDPHKGTIPAKVLYVNPLSRGKLDYVEEHPDSYEAYVYLGWGGEEP